MLKQKTTTLLACIEEIIASPGRCTK